MLRPPCCAKLAVRYAPYDHRRSDSRQVQIRQGGIKPKVEPQSDRLSEQHVGKLAILNRKKLWTWNLTTGRILERLVAKAVGQCVRSSVPRQPGNDALRSAQRNGE